MAFEWFLIAELVALLALAVGIGWYVNREKRLLINKLESSLTGLQSDVTRLQNEAKRKARALENVIEAEAGGFEELTTEWFDTGFDGFESEIARLEDVHASQFKIASSLEIGLDVGSTTFDMVQDLKAKLSNSENLLESLRSQLKSARGEVEAYKAKSIELHRKVMKTSTAEVSERRLGREVTRLRKQMDKLRTSIANERGATKTLIEENRSLVKRLKTSFTNEDLRMIADERDAYRARLERAENDLSQLEATMIDETELEMFKRENEILKQQILSIQESGEDSEALKDLLAKMEREKQQLEETIILMDRRMNHIRLTGS